MLKRIYLTEIEDIAKVAKIVNQNLGKFIRTNLNGDEAMNENETVEGILTKDGNIVRRTNGGNWSIDLYTENDDAWIEIEVIRDTLNEHDFDNRDAS